MYRCKIIGGKTGFLVDTPKTSILCEDDQGICVEGAKQPLYAYQARFVLLPLLSLIMWEERILTSAVETTCRGQQTRQPTTPDTDSKTVHSLIYSSLLLLSHHRPPRLPLQSPQGQGRGPVVPTNQVE
jgi:hypothetical protein